MEDNRYLKLMKNCTKEEIKDMSEKEKVLFLIDETLMIIMNGSVGCDKEKRYDAIWGLREVRKYIEKERGKMKNKLLVAVAFISGCDSDAEQVSYNISKDAEQLRSTLEEYVFNNGGNRNDKKN